MNDVEDFLAHYGVKGMKWGKRKAPLNPNYSEQQYKRDSQVYGRRGANRINKNMHKGDQVSTARGMEKTRRDNVMAKNKYVRQAGKLGGGAVGAGVGFVASKGIAKAANSSLGQRFIMKTLGNHGPLAVNALNSPIATAAIAAGSAKVGYMLAGDAAVAVRMRAHGYNQNRK